MDLANRLPPPEFELKTELLSGRSKVLTKTDCLTRRDSRAKNIRLVSTITPEAIRRKLENSGLRATCQRLVRSFF